VRARALLAARALTRIFPDRKVRCDLAEPECTNCVRSRRQCLGYGLRLSWPRDGRGRRALAYAPPVVDDTGAADKSPLFLNVTSEDVKLHYDLSESRVVGASAPGSLGLRTL
jgi:hypothetical protein